MKNTDPKSKIDLSRAIDPNSSDLLPGSHYNPPFGCTTSQPM
jgi:hypothetical protein